MDGGMTGHDAPLLLVGAQRSGTTALAYALSSAIAEADGCFTVNGRLPHLLRRWWTVDDLAARHVRADEVVHSLGRRAPEGTGAVAWHARATRAVLDGAERVAEHGPALDPIDEVRRICAEAYGTTAWGDKYNEHLLDLGWLDAVFPQARWVFLAREPEEVVASMLAWSRPKPWNPRTAEAAADKWAHFNRQWLAFRDSVPAGRRVELHYGALCRGEREGLDELAGVELSGALASFRRRERPRYDGPLAASALAVRDELRALGLLDDLGAGTPVRGAAA
jgi:hypothetical protein